MLLFGAGWAIAAVALAAQTPEDLAEGLKLARELRFDEAFQAFQRHVRANPEDPLGHYYSGMSLRQADRKTEAVVELRKALDLAPQSAEFRYALAITLAELNQLDEALEALHPFRDDTSQGPADPSALWLLSDIYFRQESMGDALKTLDRYAQTAPGDIRVHLRKGQIALLQGDWKGAKRAFESSIAQAPETAPAHHGLGIALWRGNRLDEALQAFEKAVELDPDSVDFRLDLGKLLIDRERASDALPHLLLIASKSPAPPEVHFELARAYRRIGDSQKAERHLAQFKESQVQDQSQRQGLDRAGEAVRRGSDLLSKNSVAAALKAFLEALNYDPDNWMAHSYLAKIYLSSRRPQDADPHLQKMMALDPQSMEGNFLLATYYYRVGRHSEALVAAEKAKAKRPDYGELRNLLGNIYFALGRRREAVGEYKAAIELSPERQDFRLNYETAIKK